MNLTPIQETIVKEPGNLIVQASAGTGKTHTMVNKIAYELEKNKTHKSIAAITFTIKAAQQIRDRITINSENHFIGTNNSFVIEEIIKPFMKDVYGASYDKDMSTDYSFRVRTFDEGVNKILNDSILCSYNDNHKNFIFELAKKIMKSSKACQLYLTSKYFHIYIDEYQDCDRDMHSFFMYLVDELGIDIFVVGDMKQSIYSWRGAYPAAFKSILSKNNFKSFILNDNFRSSKQIQNYSNILCEETRQYYTQCDEKDGIILLGQNAACTWENAVIKNLDKKKKLAFLRYSKANAQAGAEILTSNGFQCTYIPSAPISEITTNSAWFYNEVAKFNILERYSVYDFVSEIPAEGEFLILNIRQVEKHLYNLKKAIGLKVDFIACLEVFAQFLGIDVRSEHVDKLYDTIIDKRYHAAFKPDDFEHVSLTFHSSKGLEFEQVIIFAEDYPLNDLQSIYNHYVASTRAKTKLIIVKTTQNMQYDKNFKTILECCGLKITDVLTVM